MNLRPYHHLSLFAEIVLIIQKHHIHCWQVNDFWKKIKVEFSVEVSNVNYQNIYRLTHRLVRDGYLDVDPEKNEMSCKTYSETPKMRVFREKFCTYDISLSTKVEKYCLDLEGKIQSLSDEITIIEELNAELPQYSEKLNLLRVKKTKEVDKHIKKFNIHSELLCSLPHTKN